MDAVVFLSAPFAMILIMLGIHCYLGLHVLARGVIFVDLSLAQVAALGATMALLIDPDGHHSFLSYALALGFTFLASILFAAARRFEKQFPQEALIGITYALASAGVILVIDQMAHGAEHLKEALVGQILWTSWSEVLKAALIYAGVGIVHWIFRDKFLNSSFKGQDNHFFWNFLFYALFGIIITSSTPIAGVLLVFSFLIVPAVTSTFFFKTIKARLIFGWIFGGLVCLLGLWVSFLLDLPVGAALVALMTIIPISILIVLFLSKWSRV